VGLLVALRPKDRPPAPPGKDADPKEYLWYFEGREAKPVTSRQARQCRVAVIGGRRERSGDERSAARQWVEGREKAH
jgi:hypothetical protein